MKTCFECFSEMPDQAEVCHACGRRNVGKACPECAEWARQKANSIKGLPKASGQRIKAILERMKE